MKRLLFIITFTVFLIPVVVTAETVPGSQDYEYQWPVSIFPTETPLGDVKTITETAYTMAEENAHRVFKYKLILQYSDEGLLESEEYYNEDGSPGNRIDYTYENGLLVLKTQSHPDVKNPDREIYTHTPDGRILDAEKIFSTGNYGWRFQNSYDDTGRIILTSKYDRYWNWMLVYSRMFEYDELGRLSVTEGFGMESELLWRDEHSYDELGRVSESVKYNPDSDIVVRIRNEYNGKDQFTRREFTDKDGYAYAVYSYGWNYDKTGNWISKVIGREVPGNNSVYLVPDSMISREIEYYQ